MMKARLQTYRTVNNILLHIFKQLDQGVTEATLVIPWRDGENTN